MAVTVENVTIGYGGRGRKSVVACGVSATLRRGELVALLGRNGAGKSTLLRTLSLLQRPLEGRVLFGRDDAATLSPQELSRRVSVVFAGNLQTNIQVRELVALGRAPHTNFFGSLTPHDNEIVENAMAQMGVEMLAGRMADALSDGERQKCMLAKAIAQETSLLLLDEPTAFLDFQSKVHLFRTMRLLSHGAGKAVLVSTHDVEMALQYADRIWLLHDKKLHEGTVEELAAKGLLQTFINGEGIEYNSAKGRIEITQI